ncbi:DUF502 domain-containing protein [Alicyclobacillus fodiniaquatilis]|jgi:uncharacterized membrane protein|uniref:DUF502 domain-containing protein n=1 Tax=Alicyclobacillus fodiniaquatilis TaxID=1661150 RepID=A0ABW4JF43_9BACL
MKFVIRQTVKHFGIGLATVLPFLFAIWVVVFVVNQVDALVGQYITWIGWRVPGLGFVLVLAAITFVGLMTRIYISRVMLTWADALFKRIPVVKSLYTMAKDLLARVVGRRSAFQQPVLVQWPDERALVLGFMTAEQLPATMDPEGNHVSVYLPNAFQFAGVTAIVAKERIRAVDMTVEQAWKFALSAGLGQSIATDSQKAPQESEQEVTDDGGL